MSSPNPCVVVSPVAGVAAVDDHPVQAVPLPAPRHRELQVLRVGDTRHDLIVARQVLGLEVVLYQVRQNQLLGRL